MTRNILLFEEFKKAYKQEISLEDFKNLKAGDTVLYQGTSCIVETPGEFSIELKSTKTNKIFPVNYAMFNKDGAISTETE